MKHYCRCIRPSLLVPCLGVDVGLGVFVAVEVGKKSDSGINLMLIGAEKSICFAGVPCCASHKNAFCIQVPVKIGGNFGPFCVVQFVNTSCPSVLPTTKWVTDFF